MDIFGCLIMTFAFAIVFPVAILLFFLLLRLLLQLAVFLPWNGFFMALTPFPNLNIFLDGAFTIALIALIIFLIIAFWPFIVGAGTVILYIIVALLIIWLLLVLIVWLFARPQQGSFIPIHLVQISGLIFTYFQGNILSLLSTTG
jgi:hypothetical protein